MIHSLGGGGEGHRSAFCSGLKAAEKTVYHQQDKRADERRTPDTANCRRAEAENKLKHDAEGSADRDGVPPAPRRKSHAAVRRSACHPARCTARQGVGSQAEPVAPVGECSMPDV